MGKKMKGLKTEMGTDTKGFVQVGDEMYFMGKDGDRVACSSPLSD